MVLPELQGRGSKTVLVSLRIFRGTRRLEKGWRKAREHSCMKIIFLPGNTRAITVGGGGERTFLYLNFVSKLDRIRRLGFLTVLALKSRSLHRNRTKDLLQKRRAWERRLFNGERRGKFKRGERSAPGHAPRPGRVFPGSSSYLVAFLTK